jgi:hypothetical protein
MNAALSNAGTAPVTVTTVDDRNPWIGLASFTEETRDYFYGREEEVAELARRVQRKLLTVLFGQSGLGKTSILRAGLVPKLRSQGYCPVYVRVDYSREAPDPADQIKQAIARTARRSGQWTQVGVAAEGETLWEFLHHRDDVLQDENGKTLIPLVIFDQFEEVFTVAQADDFGRARAARFIADLADLVENRPPASLEARLEADDSTAERFDFARSDYRVLLALREDYLAPLESLKSFMPSVTQNRLRLARMTGAQGLAAVLLPGKRLVTEEVAAAIVRFVAGGAEIQNAEVEPSLLSLICRELNDTRIAQGRAEISLDLLAGSHATILSNFYERALADQPPAARRIVEDELLTDSGFRENIAEERLKRSFANAGVPAETLSTLVNRRLLRIEERLDVRRVELTHDVLCGVVKSSRDIRHEREAREATERLLVEQREREAGARRALVKARQVAAVCIVLAIGAVAAAIFAYWSTQRATRAEAMAQQSRVQAEQLLGYLTDDFARELESFGRLDIVASLSRREVDYFHALPEELKGPSTVRTGAIAMTQYGRSSRTLGNIDAAQKALAESRQLLEGLRKNGDTSSATTIALARAISTQGRVLSVLNDGNALQLSQQAVDLVKPIAEAPNASPVEREAYVDLLVQLGYQTQNSTTDFDKAIGILQQAMSIAASLGARTLDNLFMADRYTEAAAWIVQSAAIEGKGDVARRVAADAGPLADRILAARPSDMNALYAQGVIQSNLAYLAVDEMRPGETFDFAAKGVAVQERLVALDPGNTIAKGNLAVARGSMADASWVLGRPAQALEYEQQAINESVGATRAGSGIRLQRMRLLVDFAYRAAQMGRFEEAAAKGQDLATEAARLRADVAKDSTLRVWGDAHKPLVDCYVALARGDARTALSISRAALAPIDATQPRPGPDHFFKWSLTYALNSARSQAEFLLGDFAASETSARAAYAARAKTAQQSNFDMQDMDAASTLIALTLAAQKREAEAFKLMEPVMKNRRAAQARNHGDNEALLSLATALYVQALADPSHRASLLKESAALMDSTPAAFRKLRYVQLWRNRVTEAMRGGVAR